MPQKEAPSDRTHQDGQHENVYICGDAMRRYQQVRVENLAGFGFQHIKAGAVYFACVFAAGFALGAIRIPFLVPRLGVRIAELLEMPVMFVVILMSAKWIVRRFQLPAVPPIRLTVGVIALVLMLLAEFSMALLLQGLSAIEYLSTRDPVSGTVYYLMLLLFAAMPVLLDRK